jgi:diguanylate cyclase (GGDEF)-like protein
MMATRAVGWACGFEYYAWLIIPLAAISTRNSRARKILIVTLASITGLAMDYWLQSVPPLIALSATTIGLLHTFNLAAYFTIMAVLAFFYAQTVAEAERGLHKHATTDVLTGLRNRRRLLELARGELARARRSGGPVSIIMADIDLFKSINDRYGHPTGDQVIVSIAQCLQQCVRAQDHTARWGGEEFIVVLPDIDMHGAHAAAERMRQRIEELRVPTDAQPLRCTASFGVSEWKHGRGETFEQCLDKADAALYCAKQMGRNRVCMDQTTLLQDLAVAEVLSAGTATHSEQTTSAASHITQVMPAHRNAS